MKADKIYFAPGRVNLIGEHLDYNGGLVLPAALSRGITAYYTKKGGSRILFRSATHSFSKEIDLDDVLEFNTANEWVNYPIGIVQLLKKEGHFIPACEITYESNLPEASGLSSSAAIEVLTAFLLLDQSEANINRVWLANFCKQVENEFIRVNCGIMDQFSVAMGKAENAILLNCATVEHHYVPVQLNNYRLVIMDTKVPRSLIKSKYNERKSECDEALRILQASLSIRNLCEAEMKHLDLIKDEVIKKRARHVITENLRVKESVKALKWNDLFTFGKLMNASHASLKNDYEVTGLELDAIAEEGQQLNGCLGARMTGAGFGGCAIALVNKDNLDEFKAVLTGKYKERTGGNCEIYESEIGDGVRRLLTEVGNH